MRKILIGIALGTPVVVIAGIFMAIKAWIVQLAFNMSIAELCNIGPMTFWQAFGLTIGVDMLFPRSRSGAYKKFKKALDKLKEKEDELSS